MNTQKSRLNRLPARHLARWLVAAALAVAIPSLSYAVCPPNYVNGNGNFDSVAYYGNYTDYLRQRCAWTPGTPFIDGTGVLRTPTTITDPAACESAQVADLQACVADIQALVNTLPPAAQGSSGCPADPSACVAEVQSLNTIAIARDVVSSGMRQQLATLTATTTTQINALKKQAIAMTALVTDTPKPGDAVGVRQIVIDPADLSTQYVAVYGSGIYKRVAGGAWSATAGQPTNLNINALVLKDSSTLFAASYGGGVFISSDSGSTWAACANTGGGMTNLNLRSLALTGATLYAGSDAGVFTSSDGCATWSALSTGLPQ